MINLLRKIRIFNDNFLESQTSYDMITNNIQVELRILCLACFYIFFKLRETLFSEYFIILAKQSIL